MSDEVSRPTSSPPEAKSISALGAALALVIGQLTELAVAGMATYALVEGKIGTEVWAGICLAVTVGPGIGKATGKLGGPTSAIVLGFAGKGALAEALRRILL